MWSPEKDRENPLLEQYEFFLNHVEDIIESPMSDNVRNKNWNIFHTFCKVAGSQELMKELSKKYIIRWAYEGDMIRNTLEKRKQDILAWKQYMFPVISIDDDTYTLRKIIFLEKRDTLWDFREKINKWVWWIIPWKTKEA